MVSIHVCLEDGLVKRARFYPFNISFMPKIVYTLTCSTIQENDFLAPSFERGIFMASYAFKCTEILLP